MAPTNFHYCVTYSYSNGLRDVSVKKYETRDGAEAEAKAPSSGSEGAFAVSMEDTLVGISTQMLLDLYNHWRDDGDSVVKKFESRKTGVNRFLVRLETKFNNLPVSEGPARPTDGAAVEGTTNEGENDMAKTEKKAKRAKAEATGAPKKATRKATGQPAGKVSEFKPVREGSIRHQILKMLNGKSTAAEIADELKSKPSTISSHIYCLKRDCGIGYDIDEGGRVKAVYPGDKTLKDAVKPAKAE